MMLGQAGLAQAHHHQYIASSGNTPLPAHAQYQNMEGFYNAPATVAAPTTTNPLLDQQQYYPQLPQPLPQQQPTCMRRKRKAESQDTHNERLTKRMSLLNIGKASHLAAILTHFTNTLTEQNGTRLYVPVEQPQLPEQATPPIASASALASASSSRPLAPSQPAIDERMQLDDSKHKVYIYNLDDELSTCSSDNDDPEPEQGRLAFLPDIEKHLRANRIPLFKPILPNKDGELAGMQLVLYSDGPTSITVPEEQDSVRKAVLEARARVRQKQAEARGDWGTTQQSRPTKTTFATPVRPVVGQIPQTQVKGDMMLDQPVAQSSKMVDEPDYQGDDADAMDID